MRKNTVIVGDINKIDMKLTRKELYDLVWAEPMTTIAKRFGLSDNGLRKHCKSMNIPTPSVGYWSKLAYGKAVEKIPFPDEYEGKKQEVNLQEMQHEEIVEMIEPMDKQKRRESEILSWNTDCLTVPEVLYAKEPLIMDTKEKFRLDHGSENIYLEKNPYKSKIKETLDVYVSEKSLDRALSIFSTVIRVLRLRGHNIKINGGKTFAIINEEEIRINILERRKQQTIDGKLTNTTAFCSELHFNIFYNYNDKKTYKDTPYTKIEDKIASIIAFLEIKSDEIKEERQEREHQRKIQEEKERIRKEFEAKKANELKEFQSLFIMAERLFKANVIRNYIDTYEEYLRKKEISDKDVLEKLQWARDKADWLDPFISKEDQYMDCYDKDKIIQPDCPKQQPSRSSGSIYNFWAKPWWKK